MNKERVINIIREPLRMENEKDLPLIKELVEEFPYFSAPYMLLTKLLAEQKSIYLDKYLKLSASYAGSREVLYNFIHAPMAEREPAPGFANTFQSGNKAFLEEESPVPIAENSIAETNQLSEVQESIAFSTPLEPATEAQEITEVADSEPDTAIASHDKVEEKSDLQVSDSEKTEEEVLGTEAHEEKLNEGNSHIADAEKMLHETQITEPVIEDEIIETAGEEPEETESSAENSSVVIPEEESIGTEEKSPADYVVETEVSSVPDNTTPIETIAHIEQDETAQKTKQAEPFEITEEERIAEPANLTEETEQAEESGTETAQTNNRQAETIEQQDLTEQHEEKKQLSEKLDLPPLAAYDYFAFSNINKSKPAENETEAAGQADQELQTEVLSQSPLTVTEILNNKQKPLKFADWLNSLKTNVPPAAEEILNPKAISGENENSYSEAVKQTVVAELPKAIAEKPQTVPERKPKRNEVEDIISKFIQSEPRIKPKPAKFFTPQDVAERSAEEDNTLATETLANIYLRQGLNEKAIEIFKQLMLKYPQKSNYFAVKINEINTNP